MRIIIVLLLVGLSGCSTPPSSYYGEYTRGGERAGYMEALEECRVAAKDRANRDNYADAWTAVWLSYVDEYVLACMNKKGFELVNRKLPSKASPSWGD